MDGGSTLVTRVVGIGGKLASGKDATSDYLVDTYGWVKLGMSDALAKALYTLNPYVLIQRKFLLFKWTKWIRYSRLFDAEGYVQAKVNTEVRRLLQTLGTEVGRKQIDDNVWVNMMVKNVRAAVETGVPGVIVTGVRFDNELSAIMETLGGETWWVNRPSLTDTVNAGHASENSVSADDFSIVIENDGTLEDLYAKVDRLVT